MYRRKSETYAYVLAAIFFCVCDVGQIMVPSRAGKNKKLSPKVVVKRQHKDSHPICDDDNDYLTKLQREVL
jgi:hypothetical protein